MCIRDRGKGFTDVYELAAEKLGLESKNCVVYEDIVAVSYTHLDRM